MDRRFLYFGPNNHNPAITIDCDAAPFCPKELKVKSHSPGGKVSWDPRENKICLFQNEKQKKDWRQGSENILSSLDGMSVMNACLLDAFLAYPGMIIDDSELELKTIIFWGTQYEDEHGRLYVRALRATRLGSKRYPPDIQDIYLPLSSDFCPQDFAAIMP